MALVTGPHACTPRIHSQWVVGPGRTPERTSGKGWGSAGPQMPHTQARGAPPGRPRAAPTSAPSQHAGARAVGLVTGPHARTPRTQSQWVVGPVCTPQKTGGRGLGERPTPDAPNPGKGRPPRGALVPPPQCARPARKSARCGVGDRSHTRTPRTDSQWVVDPGSTPQRTGGRG